MLFVQAKRRDFTVTSAAKSGDAPHFKLNNYLVIRMCIIYNLLLLKLGSPSTFPWWRDGSVNSFKHNLKSSGSSPWQPEMQFTWLPWYCPYSLQCCHVSASRVTPSQNYITALPARFQNKSTATKKKHPQKSLLCIYKDIIMKIEFAHYFPTHVTCNTAFGQHTPKEVSSCAEWQRTV